MMTSVRLIFGISEYTRNFREHHTSTILQGFRLKFDWLSSVRRVIFRFMCDVDNNHIETHTLIDRQE